MAWRFAGGNLNWSAMVVDPQKVAKAARKFPGVVMFPTSHDITPAILPACLTTLKNMLSAPVASTAPAAPPANKISITSVPSKPMVMVIIINKRAAKKIP